MEVKVYNQKGMSAGILELDDKVFALPWKPDLVWEVLKSERSNRRSNSAKTKDRAEVSGGGKKPWQQKGTGRARHGSIRSPLWVGGGVTHGPVSERDFSKKINKKAKRKALLTLLSQKLRDGEMVFMDEINFPDGKTKKAGEVLKNISKVKGFEAMYLKSKVLVLLPRPERSAIRSLRNINNIEVKEARNLSPLDLASHRFVLLSKDASKVLTDNFGLKS